MPTVNQEGPTSLSPNERNLSDYTTGGDQTKELLSGFSTGLSSLLTGIDENSKAGVNLAKAARETDAILAKGSITQAELQTIQEAYDAAASSPNLPIPTKELLDQFSKLLHAFPIGQDGRICIMTSKGNVFLTPSASLELFKITTEIAKELSKIMFAESMKKIEINKCLIAMADSIAKATVAAGKLAKEQELAQASAAASEAGAVLSSALFSASFSILSSFLQERSYNVKMKQTGSVEAAAQAQRTTATRLDAISKVIDASGTTWSKSIESYLHSRLAELKLSEAEANAVSKYQEQLSSLFGKNADVLGQSASEMQNSIKEILELFKKVIEVLSQLGSV